MNWIRYGVALSGVIAVDTLTALAIKPYPVSLTSAGREWTIHLCAVLQQGCDWTTPSEDVFAVLITPGIPDLMRRCASGYGKKME
jgi:hypothetical protein